MLAVLVVKTAATFLEFLPANLTTFQSAILAKIIGHPPVAREFPKSHFRSLFCTRGENSHAICITASRVENEPGLFKILKRNQKKQVLRQLHFVHEMYRTVLLLEFFSRQRC